MSRQRPNIVAEAWGLLREHKKWWLVPVVLALVLIGVLILVAGSGAGPFLYSIF